MVSDELLLALIGMIYDAAGVSGSGSDFLKNSLTPLGEIPLQFPFSTERDRG
jgi:hypothetical protein